MFLKIAAGVLIGGVIGVALGYYGKCSSGSCPLTANPYRGAVYGALMGVFIAMAFNSSSGNNTNDKSSKQLQTQTKEKKQMVIHIENALNFQTKVLGADEVSLVDFYSDRCPPCKMLAPIIGSLAEKYGGKANICKVNVDIIPSLAQRYNIRVIPTVLIIENGREIERIVGLRSEGDYSSLLEKLIAQEQGSFNKSKEGV